MFTTSSFEPLPTMPLGELLDGIAGGVPTTVLGVVLLVGVAMAVVASMGLWGR